MFLLAWPAEFRHRLQEDQDFSCCPWSMKMVQRKVLGTCPWCCWHPCSTPVMAGVGAQHSLHGQSEQRRGYGAAETPESS